MARGNEIIVTAEPKGVFLEVIVVGTPKPGTCMVPVPDTAIDANGKISMEPAGTTAASGARGMQADGDKIPIAVLLADDKQGKTATDAYVTGTRGMVYFPLMGEELNVLKLDVGGTGDDFVVGDPLMVDDGTGKVLLSTSTTSQTAPESEPFIALESVTDPVADQLVHVMFTGC